MLLTFLEGRIILVALEFPVGIAIHCGSVASNFPDQQGEKGKVRKEEEKNPRAHDSRARFGEQGDCFLITKAPFFQTAEL